MKRNPFLTATLLLLAFALFATAAPPAMALDCNLVTGGGSFAYSFSGSVFNTQANTFVPVATVGQIYLDGHGKATGSETQASPAPLAEVTYTGTYKENADCTGTVSLTTSANQNINVYFVEANDLNEAYLIITSPGYVMTGTTKRVKYHGH